VESGGGVGDFWKKELGHEGLSMGMNMFKCIVGSFDGASEVPTRINSNPRTLGRKNADTSEGRWKFRPCVGSSDEN
jgi:hypothetical protein